MAKRDTESEAVDEDPVEAEVATVGAAAARRARGERPDPRGRRRADPNPAAPPRKHRDCRLGRASRADLHDRVSPRAMRPPSGSTAWKSATSCARKWAASALPRTPSRRFEPADPRADHAEVAGVRRDHRPDRARRADELAQPALARTARRGSETAAPATAQAPVPTPAAPQQAAPAVAGQPVVLTASEPVWLQVSEKGGATLFSGMLQAGQTFAVPATATAPVLKTGKPEALQDQGRQRRRAARRAGRDDRDECQPASRPI